MQCTYVYEYCIYIYIRHEDLRYIVVLVVF